MSRTEAPACWACRFWDLPGASKTPSAAYSERPCLRRAPAVAVMILTTDPEAEELHKPTWPHTRGTQWCGDFEDGRR